MQETKSFQFKLTQLARKLTEQGHGILILIDELQANSPEIRQLVTAYQELVGEGRTWWTLIRLDAVWDYNKDVADKRESNANILLWPITQESIIKNSKLKQTEGWY